MVWSRRVRFVAVGVVVGAMVAGCQVPPVQPRVAQVAPVQASTGSADAGRLSFDLPHAWGGEARCGLSGCLLGAVEHENNRVVLHQLAPDRTSRLLSSYAVPYHPDSAKWLTDDLLAAAVEDSGVIEILRVGNGKLTPVQTVSVGFGPRDVMLVQAQAGGYRLLATPYIGEEVAWIDWQDSGAGVPKVQKSRWCKSPWHPVKVNKLPQAAGAGIAVGCLDDKRVVAVSGADPSAPVRVLATFNAVPRQVRPSPSGQWLYVALETGGRNARIHMDSGELQWIAGSPKGSVSVALLSDDLVIWGDDGLATLQRLDAQGGVLETRGLATSGFSTTLQLLDVDGDGQLDLVVLNSADNRSDVIYGPLWDKAAPRP